MKVRWRLEVGRVGLGVEIAVKEIVHLQRLARTHLFRFARLICLVSEIEDIHPAVRYPPDLSRELRASRAVSSFALKAAKCSYSSSAKVETRNLVNAARSTAKAYHLEVHRSNMLSKATFLSVQAHSKRPVHSLRITSDGGPCILQQSRVQAKRR